MVKRLKKQNVFLHGELQNADIFGLRCISGCVGKRIETINIKIELVLEFP